MAPNHNLNKIEGPKYILLECMSDIIHSTMAKVYTKAQSSEASESAMFNSTDQQDNKVCPSFFVKSFNWRGAFSLFHYIHSVKISST